MKKEQLPAVVLVASILASVILITLPVVVPSTKKVSITKEVVAKEISGNLQPRQKDVLAKFNSSKTSWVYVELKSNLTLKLSIMVGKEKFYSKKVKQISGPIPINAEGKARVSVKNVKNVSASYEGRIAVYKQVSKKLRSEEVTYPFRLWGVAVGVGGASASVAVFFLQRRSVPGDKVKKG